MPEDPEKPENPAPPPESFLERLLAQLATPETRKRVARKILRGIRISLWAATGLYLLPLLFAAVAAHWWAEKNLTLAFLTFVPAQLWLLPIIPLFVITLPFSRKIAGLQLLFAIGYVFIYMDYQPGTENWAPGKDSITILSYNRGQHANQSLQPFKNKIKPDLLALQDAGGRAANYAQAEGYTEFKHFDSIGEFTLLSKFPILNKELIDITINDQKQDVASRFEIKVNEQNVAVYSVHMPTPRDVLLHYRRGAFLYGIIGIPGTKWGERRIENQRYWDQRVELAKNLADLIKKEPLPAIIVGDFNAPDHGYVYHLFAKPFQDAHEEVGTGFGNTFPGKTRNPITLFGPWLRLDYAFCNDGFEPISFITESDRPSQHRAIAAEYFFVPRDFEDHSP